MIKRPGIVDGAFDTQLIVAVTVVPPSECRHDTFDGSSLQSSRALSMLAAAAESGKRLRLQARGTHCCTSRRVSCRCSVEQPGLATRMLHAVSSTSAFGNAHCGGILQYAKLERTNSGTMGRLRKVRRSCTMRMHCRPSSTSILLLQTMVDDTGDAGGGGRPEMGRKSELPWRARRGIGAAADVAAEPVLLPSRMSCCC